MPKVVFLFHIFYNIYREVDMSKQLVKMLSVEINVPVEKRDGGTYQATKLVYTDGSGRTITKAIGTEHLARPENVPLAMKLRTLAQQTPTEVVLSTVKNGAYTNVVDLESPSDVPTSELAETTTTGPTEKTQSSMAGSTGGGTYKGKSSYGGKSPEERRSIQAQVALKAAVDLAIGRGGNITEIVQNAKTFNSLLSELVG